MFDHQFGLHVIDMGTIVFHDTVVTIVQWAVLQRWNDRVGVNTRRNLDTPELPLRRSTGLPGTCR